MFESPPSCPPHWPPAAYHVPQRQPVGGSPGMQAGIAFGEAEALKPRLPLVPRTQAGHRQIQGRGFPLACFQMGLLNSKGNALSVKLDNIWKTHSTVRLCIHEATLSSTDLGSGLLVQASFSEPARTLPLSVCSILSYPVLLAPVLRKMLPHTQSFMKHK